MNQQLKYKPKNGFITTDHQKERFNYCAWAIDKTFNEEGLKIYDMYSLNKDTDDEHTIRIAIECNGMSYKNIKFLQDYHIYFSGVISDKKGYFGHKCIISFVYIFKEVPLTE